MENLVRLSIAVPVVKDCKDMLRCMEKFFRFADALAEFPLEGYSSHQEDALLRERRCSVFFTLNLSRKSAVPRPPRCIIQRFISGIAV